MSSPIASPATVTAGSPDLSLALMCEQAEAERRAWEALARYKFWMFGYWAAVWVHLNRLSGQKNPNPFRKVVHLARRHLEEIGK
jgi:hypothetical protein